MDALRINPDGTHHFLDGDVTSTKWLTEQIGCQWLEAINLGRLKDILPVTDFLDVDRRSRSLYMWFDEEGRLGDPSPVNYGATLVASAVGRNLGHFIVGTALFTEVRGDDNVPLQPAVGDYLTELVERFQPEIQKFRLMSGQGNESS